MSTERRPRVLLGSTGSVASIKVAALCRLLLEFADVKLIVTSSAKHFINEDDLPDAAKPVLGDEAEWRQWRVVGDPVLHIDLRRWADVLVVAPLSANTLAKMAAGMADNLLTCVVRAWDFGAKPMLLAPAMNTAMWASPFTSRHINTLIELGSAAAASTSSSAVATAAGGAGGAATGPAGASAAAAAAGDGAAAVEDAIAAAASGGGGGAAGAASGGDAAAGGTHAADGGAPERQSTVTIIPPVSKRLACGDEGTGAMASPEDIAAAVRRAVAHILQG